MVLDWEESGQVPGQGGLAQEVPRPEVPGPKVPVGEVD